jgi:glycerophosphoryl diester phosphodiesterase
MTSIHAHRGASCEAPEKWVIDRNPPCPFDELIEKASDSGLDALDLSASRPLDRTRVARARRAGLKVYIWTVDDVGMARQLAAAGVDGITTNTPARIRQTLA